jgi:alkanesulfonate monooxygenase SsuD/methylene tetrahydromethanopterin reductase-like flavin-dependent oxidoreductase (luciferase family)
VGRDFEDITRTVPLLCMVDADESAIERAARQGGRSIEDFLGSSMAAIGSADQVVERLARYEEAGCRYFILYFPDAAWGDSIEAFAEGVIPALR